MEDKVAAATTSQLQEELASVRRLFHLIRTEERRAAGLPVTLTAPQANKLWTKARNSVTRRDVPLPRTPHPAAAKFVMQRMKSLGVLTSTDGPFNSVIKIKPPMCFDENDAARLAEALDQAIHDYTTLSLEG